MSQRSHGSSFSGGGRPALQKISFASRYGFKPEGVRLITQWYERKLGKLNLPSNYDYKLEYDTEDHIFTFTAPEYVADDVIGVLIQAIDRMINTECRGDRPEDYEEQVVNQNSTKIWLLDDIDAENVAVPLGDETFPIDIRYYSARREWRSTIPNKGMAAVITRGVQECIMKSIPGVRLMEDLNHQKIFVASNEENQTSLAVKKLENVERFWTERVRVDYHVFFTETITDYQVCFLLFPMIKKRLPETTLLDPGVVDDILNDYHQLNRRITVRCCTRLTRPGSNIGNGVYILKKGEKLRPVIHDNQKQNPSLQWASFSYAGKGKWTEPKRLKGSILTEDSEPLNMVDITSWTQGLPDAAETIKTSIDDLLHSQNHEDLSSYPILSEHLRIAMRSVALDEENTETGTQASYRHNSISSSTFTSQYDTPAVSISTSRNDDPFITYQASPRSNSSSETLTAIPLPATASELFPQLSPNVVESSRSSYQNAARKLEVAATSGVIGQKSRMTTLNTREVKDDASIRQLAPRATFDNASGHAESLLDITITQPSATISSNEMRSSECLDVKVQSEQLCHGHLIDLADREVPHLPSSTSRGNLHDLEGLVVPNMTELMPAEDLDMIFGGQPSPTQDELSTRKFHQTMRQKAPAISKANFFQGDLPIIVPSHECLESVERGLGKILSQMRNHCGSLTLKAELGRIIVEKKLNPHLIYKEDDYNSCEPHQAEDILSTAKIEFTNMVTTLPAEAQFVLEMKNDKGERIWKDQPISWPKIRYIFSCKDKISNSWFEVEMDGESHNYEVKTEPYTFGIVNVYGTLRNLDFRIIGQGSESLGLKYKDWAEEFVKSICIPPNRQKLEMTFEIADAYEVEILSLRVRRECDHANVNRKSILHIDEVEDMCIRLSNAAGKAKTSYWIKAYDEETNPPKLYTREWFEFSITCRYADEAFKENRKLGIGEQAEWKFNDLNNKGLVWDLCHPISQIVAEGDGLGFWNTESRPDQQVPPISDTISSRTLSSRATASNWW